MNQNEFFDQLANLQKALQEIAENKGLTMEGFAILPPQMEGGPVYAQAVFTVDFDELAKPAAQKEVDKEFERMMLGMTVTSHEEKVEDIREKGLELLRGIEGIGLSDDEPDADK